MNKTESKEPPSAQAYMGLGPGGRRIGERSRSEESWDKIVMEIQLVMMLMCERYFEEKKY